VGCLDRRREREEAYVRLHNILSLFDDDRASDPGVRFPPCLPNWVLAVNSLIISIFTGAFGMAYFIYGRRQSKVMPVVCGLLLCVYPWFTENVYALCGIGAVLIVLPFLVDF
jgi:hypothetical protein